MAAEPIDSLVTELAYTADTKVLDKADKKLKELEKQSKATATATDVLAEEQLNLKDAVQKTAEQEQKLRKEQTRLKKEIKATKKPTDDQRKALSKVDNELREAQDSAQKYRNELKRLGIQQAKIARQSRKDAQQIGKLSGARRGASSRFDARAADSRSSARETAAFFKQKQSREAAAAASAGPGGLAGVAASLGPVTAALGSVAAAGALAAAAITPIIRVGAEMEGLRARLKTVEGSVESAGAAFTLLKGIAKETPFELQDVTTAYVRLKSLGLEPTERSLKSFGNVAAAQGKPVMDFIEAVADASTGEFERLKEFGIKASSQGEEVAFSFGGMTTRVGKNAKEINAFLQELGETKFAGAMADQMNTFNGVMSNAKDGFATFLDEVAKLGVLDEAKLILQEISGTMGDDLVPIIADLITNFLKWLRETFVELRDSGGGLKATFEGLANIVSVLAAVLSPFIMLWELLVKAFNLLVQAGGFLWGLFGNILDAIAKLLEPLKELVGEFDGLTEAWEKAKDFGGGIVGTINNVTASLFEQAEAIAVVKGSLADLQKQIGDDVSKLSDSDLTKLQQAGGEAGQKAAAEVRKRVKAREASEKTEEAAQKKDAFAAKKKGRAEEVAKRFDTLNDRQLASFASDPSVSKKLRDKAEKEQIRRDKKKKKKGAKAGKKMHDATLVADIEKQIDKNARELAKADAARGLRSGKLTAATAGGFETQQFKKIRDKQLSQFRETGRLPAGIAQDVRQAAALPSINDLAGRTQAPVISNTINKYDFHDNNFTAEVTGEFATTPAQFATQSLTQFRRQHQQLLGEAVPSFRTQQIR